MLGIASSTAPCVVRPTSRWFCWPRSVSWLNAAIAPAAYCEMIEAVFEFEPSSSTCTSD